MLTIYIPTYNRLKHLQLLLTSLFVELDERPAIANNVVIKIFNNNSTDETEKYLNTLARANVFVCNRINNIGGDANIADSINHCETEYLWILGDDDIPYKGLLTKIIHYLSLHKPDLLFLPAVWSSDIFEDPMPSIAYDLVAEKQNKIQFIKTVGIKLTFISSFIFSFRHYSSFKNDQDTQLTINTSFGQLAFFRPAILSGGGLYVINRAVIRATGNSNFKYSVIHAFGIDLPNITEKIFVSEKVLADLIIQNLLIAFLPSFIYSIRFKSFKSIEKGIPWESLKSVLSHYNAFWIFVYPLKFLPKFLAFSLVVLGRFFR